MPSRFEFERAIRRSGLPPLARLLALVIATWADADTGAIARKNQPAQSVLLEATGMSKTAFLTHRKTLVTEGWIEYASPDPIKAQKEHAQNVYSILIPAGKARSLSDPAQTDEVGHDTVWARSPSDPAQSQQNGTSPDEARSPSDPALGRPATQPKTGEVRNTPEKLGRSATTRVVPASVSTPLPADGEQASSEEPITDAFAYIQPLIRAMTDAGITVSWQMRAEDYKRTARVLQRAGVEAMVEFAIATKASTVKPISYATFFLRGGWLGLPPKSTKPRATPKRLRPADWPEWCKDPDCDEKTRFRDVEDANGLRSSAPCPQCHPSRKDHAA